MSSRKETPRGLIQGVLEANSVTRSAVNASRTRRRRSLRRSLADATPGTLIRGVLQTSSTAKKSPATTRRVIPTPPLSAVRKSPRIARLPSSSGGQDPTPRGLIHGFLASTSAETPATRAVVMNNDADETERNVERNPYQGRIADLISPDVDTPETMSRTRAGMKRKREAANIGRDAFQSGILQRLQKDTAELPSFSDSTMVSPTLHSIPEEIEAIQVTTTSTTDTTRPQEEEEEEQIAALAQLATQPHATVNPPDLHESVPDTSATSLSMTSLGEVAAANTIQIHQESESHQSPSEHTKETSATDDETGQPSSTKRQKTITKEKSEITKHGMTQDVLDDIGEVEDNLEGNSQAEKLHDRSQPAGSTETSDYEEQEVSDIYSPFVTPGSLPAGRTKTPTAKTPAAYRNQDRSSQPLTEDRQRLTASRHRKPPRKPHTLPLSLTKSIFNHFCTSRVSRTAWDAIEDCTDRFFEQLSKDLAHYCKHAKRQTIQTEDVELLMKRQGLVSDTQSLYALIEKYLSMEHRQELIPCAQAGGGVRP